MAKKIFKIVLITLFTALFFYAIRYVIVTNGSHDQNFEVESPSFREISEKSIATGKIIPKEKIDVKSNLSGIVEKILVKEGDRVENKQILAVLRVIPNVSKVNSTMQLINQAKIQLDNQEKLYKRQKILYEQGVISKQEFDNSETEYLLKIQSYDQALRENQIERTGVASGLENLANIQIRATAKGVILDLPIEVGGQVIEASGFNPGTTVATIADTGKMIFEGTLDESQIDRIKIGMTIKIIIGALQDNPLEGKLTFISPLGKDDNGSVKYKLKADLNLPQGLNIRAGYSANAEIIVNSVQNALSISESLLQYTDDQQPFVEVLQPDKSFKKVNIKIGISDGQYVQVLDGISKKDKIKVWDQIEKI